MPTYFLAKNLIGSDTSAESAEFIQAVNPATGERIAPEFPIATQAEVDRAVKAASAAYGALRRRHRLQRAEFLRKIAEEIENLGEALVERCVAETGLPEGRILGERARTCNQLRMFADLVEDGSWVDATLDSALPDREPVAKPDLRRMFVPIGPVAVFGASNFPLAFSVAGGDTASAFAAGCPVIAKAHPSHPGTSELVGRAIVKAGVATGMPKGVFSLLQGLEETGRALVDHPKVEAVGFTGSTAGGRALYDLAASRRRPIPVFAEMGSVNPVFILPGALGNLPGLADGFVQSVTMGVGQFCTNPGVVLGISGAEFSGFVKEIAKKIAAVPAGHMLSQRVCENYQIGVKRMSGHKSVEVLGGAGKTSGYMAQGVVFSTDATSFLADESLSGEVFGPATLAVHCPTVEVMLEVARKIEGQLTASIFSGPGDGLMVNQLSEYLVRRVGRLIHNGFPTGVEVCPSMQHGGPYPATTDPRFTSVGTRAIYRWVRPVCWQDAPQAILPEELRDGNPAGIWRTVDGMLTKD
ncbi:aldehyde dehydrogenase (NADP(+)) [Kamptonema cortianum]|nr:aldehyde dehydrogenase (NADP(+)) [Geitlerinema splendidum]MDK3162205.1 aldehyde dehydrogenase (NADP(+)) [Kamptonema cortianum]